MSLTSPLQQLISRRLLFSFQRRSVTAALLSLNATIMQNGSKPHRFINCTHDDHAATPTTTLAASFSGGAAAEGKKVRNSREMKYVIVTGGVVSGLGKGVTASSIGVVLKACGLRVTSIKIGASRSLHDRLVSSIRWSWRCMLVICFGGAFLDS